MEHFLNTFLMIVMTNDFSYTNIFETKGIEYLAIIAFFAILVPFWLFLNKKIKIKKQDRSLSYSNLRIPQGLFFCKNHTWTYLEKSGIAKVGIDDLLTNIIGEVKIIKQVDNYKTIKKGELLAEIDNNGKRLKILSPISGIILIFNDLQEEEWIYKIQPSDWINETKTYYLASEATYWMEKELLRFKDFVMLFIGKNQVGNAVILQDGGELCENALDELPDAIWNDFQKDFLNIV